MTVNKVILIGNLGQDPELRNTKSGTAVINLRIATNERRRNAEGQWDNHTEWHSVVAFGKTAENINRFMKKGRQLYIEGRLQTRKWQDKEGNERYSTEVVADNVRFLSNRGGDGDEGSGGSYGSGKSSGSGGGSYGGGGTSGGGGGGGGGGSYGGGGTGGSGGGYGGGKSSGGGSYGGGGTGGDKSGGTSGGTSDGDFQDDDIPF